MIKEDYKIYMHKNKINNKVYIGQTKQKLEKRWKNGFSYKGSKYFWNAIQKYGWDNFEHILLIDDIESQTKANLIERYYIYLYNSTNKEYGYNIDAGGAQAVQMRGVQCKVVYQYDLNGKFIMKYTSIADASRTTNTNINSIVACCKGKQKTAGGYQWSYEYYEIGECFRDYHCKDFYQYDLQGNFVKCFHGIKDVMEELNIKCHTPIINCCNGKTKESYGYQWRYEKFDKVEPYIRNGKKVKRVCQYSLDDNLIMIYDSCNDAIVAIGKGSAQLIRACARGSVSTAYGYKWIYEENLNKQFVI